MERMSSSVRRAPWELKDKPSFRGGVRTEEQVSAGSKLATGPGVTEAKYLNKKEM